MMISTRTSQLRITRAVKREKKMIFMTHQFRRSIWFSIMSCLIRLIKDKIVNNTALLMKNTKLQ